MTEDDAATTRSTCVHFTITVFALASAVGQAVRTGRL
jgi:hypothetical protein